jgi:hypothetical protein
VLVAAALLAASPALADEAPRIVIDVVPVDSMDVVTDSLRLQLTVTNPGAQKVVVSGEKISVPRALRVGSRSESYRVELGDLEARQTKLAEVTLPGAGAESLVDLVTFQHGSYDLVLTYEVSDHGGNALYQAHQTIPVRPLGAWWAAAAGGVCGVLLHVLFRVLWAWRQRIADDPPTVATNLTNPQPPPAQHGSAAPPPAPAPVVRLTSRVRHELRLAPVSILIGTITVCIAIWLFRFTSTQAPSLPVIIEVKDFYGGGLVGLLFEPVTGWLAGLIGVAPSSSKP